MGWFKETLSSGASSVRRSTRRIRSGLSDAWSNIKDGDLWGATKDLIGVGWDAGNIMTLGTRNAIGRGLMRALTPKIPPPDYESRKTMSRNADAPHRIIYGRARVGGVVRYLESSGTDSAELHLILVFAAHSCAEIERVYFNGELAFIGDVAQGKFAGKAAIIREHGKQTGANAQIVEQTPAGWTVNHKLLGMTYAYIRLSYDRDVYQGAPNIEALVRGKDDIFNPTNNTTAWTDNQALCVRDYLMSDYGYRLTNGEVDDASFIAGAALCNELVPKGQGQTEKRYTINGAFSVVDQPLEALEMMNGAGLSSLQNVQGRVRYIGGSYTAPLAGSSFNEDDIWEPINIVPNSGASDRINMVRGTFIDPTQDYEVVDFVPVSIAAYIADDKQELAMDSKFPMTNSGATARRIAKVSLERSRFGVRVSTKLSWRAFEYSVGDRITMTIDGLGWSGKIFRIESMEYGLGGVAVELAEDAPSVWAWTEGDALTITAPPALNFPNPFIVTAPTGLNVTESLYIANDLKTVRARMTLTWDGSATASHYEIQGSLNGGAYVTLTDYQTTPLYEADDIELGSWVFRLRAVNRLGTVSGWTFISATMVGKTSPPEAVANFRGSIRPFGIELLWSPVADLDLDYYEIRQGATWATADLVQRIQATRWQWETRPTGTENLLIKAYDTSGNESPTAAIAELIISPPRQVTITPQVIDNNVLLRWTDATSSFSIDRYEVRRGEVFDNAQRVGTVKSTFANVFETEAGLYRYWIVGIDVAGNIGAAASITANVDQPPDFTLLANQSISLDDGTAINFVREIDVTEFRADSTEITADSREFTADATDGSALLGPVFADRTWLEHFEAFPNWQAFRQASDTDWSADSDIITADSSAQSIQELQIDNGYPLYAQPTPASASYEVIVDMGVVVGLSRIRLAPNTEVVAGSPVVRWYMALSEDGVSYDELETTDRVGTSFRYVRIRVEVDSDSGHDLLIVRDAILRLDVKLRTDQGVGESIATSSTGTRVFFNVPFIDIQSITVTASGSTPAIVVYDFLDEPNPTYFDVYAFNLDGDRMNKQFSWTARGV